MNRAIRSYFSGSRIRYKDESYNLDLTYITDRIMAMGFPSKHFESVYRNSIVEVANMLDSKHGKHYMVLNLSDRDYDHSYFGNRVLVCGFPDHHSPPIALMWAIYAFIDLWMAVDPKNVIAAHCLAGKGRTGIVICCTLLMQGFFNGINAKTTTEYVNAAVNYFCEKRGDGVENPDQIKFIRDFLISTDTIGADNSLQYDSLLQPSLYLGSLVLYNVAVGIGGEFHPHLVVFLKCRNEWSVVYNSAWSYYPLPCYTSYQAEIVIDINVPSRGDLLFVVSDENREVFHFSINTTQVPCCSSARLTSLYFNKNNLSVAKTTLPITQSFATQLICLDKKDFASFTPQERLSAIHVITQQAMEEERSRREALLRLHSDEGDASSIYSSIQYRDLLNMKNYSEEKPVIGMTLNTGVEDELLSKLPLHTVYEQDSSRSLIGGSSVKKESDESESISVSSSGKNLVPSPKPPQALSRSLPQPLLVSHDSMSSQQSHPTSTSPPLSSMSSASPSRSKARPAFDTSEEDEDEVSPCFLSQSERCQRPNLRELSKTSPHDRDFLPNSPMSSLRRPASSENLPRYQLETIRSQPEMDVHLRPTDTSFAHRIPFMKQISLSYKDGECETNDLSLKLPPIKDKRKKKRDLTNHEKEILSKEDIAFALCGMEDQEIQILDEYTKLYIGELQKETTASANGKNSANRSKNPLGGSKSSTSIITPNDVMSPLDYAISISKSVGHMLLPDNQGNRKPTSTLSYQIVFKTYANVYDKRIWKKRLLILTSQYLFVMKRPSDHYMKNVICWSTTLPVMAAKRKQNEKYPVTIKSAIDETLLHIQFDTFSHLMDFVAISRRLGGHEDYSLALPENCPDKDLYNDIASLVYLYDPSMVTQIPALFKKCLCNPDFFAEWVNALFGLQHLMCRNLHVNNSVEEVEDLITTDGTITSPEIYLKPHYIEVLSIPSSVTYVVRQLQQMIDIDIYRRLVQVCQFSYPSPVPLVHAIIDLYNEQWAKMFDENPYAFLRAIRESDAYCKESCTNRSYKRPSVKTGTE